ncbi:MAG: R3H domain-containing nucleic acid-binding protein [Patescibacteria group bacterium]
MKTEPKEFLPEFIEEFFAEWPIRPETEVLVEEKAIIVVIRTGKDFIFTQPNAQPLLALQHLLRLIFKKHFPDDPHRLLIDINDFRAKQQAAIDAAVKEAIWQVKAGGNSVHLLPMSSFERRLVHTHIAEEAGLTSESTGIGSERHVVIKLTAEE